MCEKYNSNKNSNAHLVFLGQLHDLQTQQKEKKMLCNKFFLCQLQKKRGKTCATFYTHNTIFTRQMPPAPAALRTLPGLIWDKVISGIEFSFSHQRQQQQHYFVITAYRTAVVNDMKLVF